MHVLGDIIRLNAKRFPDAVAVVMEGRRTTFKELNDRVNLLAHGLLELEVQPNDKAAIYAPNSIEWLIVYFALAKCGACIVPVNWRYKEEELKYAINNSESRFVFFAPELGSMINAARKDFTLSPRLISMGEDVAEKYETLSSIMKNKSDSEPNIEVKPEWPCSLTYTSGTTGAPKGVLHNHPALIGVWIEHLVEGDVEANEVTIINIPFFHVASVHCLVGPTFLRGGSIVLMAGGFDPDRVLKTVEEQKVTMTMWVPSQLAMLINSPAIGKYNISSLKKIWYGSSPIPAPVLEACLQRFKSDFYQWYGQTELGISSVLPPKDHYGEKAQFTGRESFNADLRIVNENGEDVRVGEIGEIIGRQSALGMICYHAMEEATKSAVRDGWIFTGDLARVEGNGYFTIVDRLKDMIISGGENIYPKEIEDVLNRHPGVLETAVFGVPDDVYGEGVCAAVVKRPGYELDEKGIIDFCADKLAGYKKPKKVIFVDELPRNAFGKVTKNTLREPFWAGRKKRI
jgi:fatty-acyl-CoA synthase